MEIDQLRKHIDEHACFTFDGQKFVPKRALREYLKQDKIKKFLDLYNVPRHKWEAISNDYLAVFVILLLIGHGPYILSFLPYDNLSDTFLPFLNSENWPAGSKALFKDFERTQWVFCAQELRSDRLDDKWFDPNLILSITSKIPLKSSDSKTYKIEIHPDYNLLSPNVRESRNEYSIHANCSLAQTVNALPSPKYFVLKTCPNDKVEVHMNEVRGYRTLGQQEDISNFFPQFYGSWRQADSCNILLEYVDGGPSGNTLTEVFDGEHPTGEVDLLKFWDQLVRIIEPICRIHCHGHKEGRDLVEVGYDSTMHLSMINL